MSDINTIQLHLPIGHIRDRLNRLSLLQIFIILSMLEIHQLRLQLADRQATATRVVLAIQYAAMDLE